METKVEWQKPDQWLLRDERGWEERTTTGKNGTWGLMGMFKGLFVEMVSWVYTLYQILPNPIVKVYADHYMSLCLSKAQRNSS